MCLTVNYTQLKEESVNWKIVQKSAKWSTESKRLENADERLRSKEDILGKSYTYIIGIIQGKEKGNEAETVFIMAENIPEIKNIKPQILEV